MTETKICIVCREEKPLDEFHKRTSSKDGRQSQCKPCNISRVRTWQESNPEQYEQNWKKQAYRPTRSMERRAALYGMTLEELLDRLEAAQGLCELCGGPATPRGLVVDHCHDSGAVRGILCNSCNTGLGHFKDSTELLEKAIEYLNKSRVRNSEAE